MEETHSEGRAVAVWDLPTRLVHWALVVLVAFSWWTGEYGELSWHRWSGYAILGLVLFRIYWGFAGSSTARFTHFVRGPGAVWTYSRTLLERVGTGAAGHTALGGWSIVAMLLLLLTQTGLGLFAVDVDGLESGPLSDLVTFETGRQLAKWHETTVDILIGVIALHVAAVLFYWLYKRENLFGAMFTGVKRLPRTPAPQVRIVSLWRAVVGLLVIALAVTALVTRLQL